MTTDGMLRLLSAVRSRGADRWIARCPAHEDRSPSLTIRRTADRWLIRCWAGCPAEEIVAAIGLSLADLYHLRYRRRDPLANRRRRASEGLESWRRLEIRRLVEELRGRDAIIRAIDAVVAEGTITEDEALISLEYEYRGYSELEYRFDRLLRRENVLGLWRESRKTP
jgi:hypothetical protein